MEKPNSHSEHRQQIEQTRGLFCTSGSGVARCQSVTILGNGVDVRSDLHGQVSLAAVNQMYVNHETMNGLLISLKQ